MKQSIKGQSAGTSAGARSRKQGPVEPTFPPLDRMPATPEELFRSLAVTVATTVSQPDPTGIKGPKTQHYSLPWPGFASWRDARARLAYFEKHFSGGKLAWREFNDSTSNDGPMSLNAYPGRAFIERVTNEGDANLEAAAASHVGPMPKSPYEAAALWFGLIPGSLAGGLTDDEVMEVAERTVTVVGYVGDPKDPRDLIFDARDYGIGLTAAEMPDTILSLNRGNKKSKPYVTGKHGQGASSTYQYSDLTLIVSRKAGSNLVAFTFVEGQWDDDAKTPTYRYLTINGAVPEISVEDEVFDSGTLVRHIGYNAADLFNMVGERSLYGLLMRSLAEPVFPAWLQIYTLRTGKPGGYPSFRGYRRYGRLIRGSVNALEKAWKMSVSGLAHAATDAEPAPDDPAAPTEEDIAAEVAADEPLADEDQSRAKILWRGEEHYDLPEWDFGARSGLVPLGRVKFVYWVVDPKGRSAANVLKGWVDPEKTILMTLDGQTHAEESRAIVTGQNGAKLWAVGKYMVVQIDCNGLDHRAKYDLFTSTREHAKETPIKKMILAELIRRLSFDKKLAELNVTLAAADIKQPRDVGDAIASAIKKYLKVAGISFDQLTRKVEKWTEVEEEQPSSGVKVEPPPIPAAEPPTFVRWKFSGTTVKMHPGQRHSAVFETDAGPEYWNPGDQTRSKIRVVAQGVKYVGAGAMKGGRVRCHFECPLDAVVGAKPGFIQVQLEYAPGASTHQLLPVEVVEKPPTKDKDKDKDESKAGSSGGKTPGPGGDVIKVKVRKKDFSEVDIPVVTPQPVTRSKDSGTWSILGWPNDPSRVGFSIRSLQGKVQLYYNAEFPPFHDMKRKMSKKSLEEEFQRRYEMKLVLHTIFSLNYEFVDEDDLPSEEKKRLANVLCAAAESLALATKSELEIEARLKSEDPASMATTITASGTPSPIAVPAPD